MEKFVTDNKYATFLQHLRAARMAAGLTQQQLGERVDETQTFISKCERGERRIDVIELYYLCQAMGISLGDFVKTLEIDMNETDG